VKKVILSGAKPPNAAVASYLGRDWAERRKAVPLYLIDSARAAAIVLLQFTHGSAHRAREVIAEIGKEKLSPRERREADVAHLLLMAHSLRRRVRSDTAAMKRVIGLRYMLNDEAAVDDTVRSLRYWLKGRTLAKFSRTQPCKYVFTPPNKFLFVLKKIRKKSRPDKHS
jgi:hypothetical protein